MATINLLEKHRQFGQTPYGNQSVYRFRLATNANGAAVESNQVTALAVGDKIILGQLPAGFAPTDSTLIVSTALTSGVTGSLGFEYADGEDSSDVPQDAAYFGSGLALSTAARLRNITTKAPRPLAKEANLILTIAGAANAKVGELYVIIEGEGLGDK
jgi:hypothetical protein